MGNFDKQQWGISISLDTAPAHAEPPQWAKEIAEKVVAGEKAEHEAASKAASEAAEHKAAEERKAAEAWKAAEERQQREASERQHAEEVKQAEETAEPSKEVAAKQCVVPSLKGDSATTARKVLGKAHCRLGKVKTPRGGHGLLVVTAQSVKSGSKRPGGTAVAVTLGASKRSHA